MAPLEARARQLAPNPVRFSDLARAAQASIVEGKPNILIEYVDYDSRRINQQSLFVALRGGYADGHRFLADARANGAIAALVETGEDVDGYEAWAVVPDTRKALSPLSAHFFDYPGNNLGIVGVTGTDGKTTTSFLIESLFRSNCRRTGMIGTIAIRVGDEVREHDTRQTTPESLEVHRLLAEMASKSVDWAVLEATSHGLAMHRLDDCPFDIAVVTNITREHLDFHGSINAYRAAKARLLEFTSARENRSYPAGVVLNRDDEGCRAIANHAGALDTIWFSYRDSDADVFAHDIRSHPHGTRFRLNVADHETEVDLKLLGTYNVSNAMAAAGAGHISGLDIDQIRGGLESLQHVPGRMQRVHAGQSFNIVVDYAHSPASLTETLQLLRNVTTGKLIAVSGSAGERDRGKRAIQGRISAELADFSVFTSEDPRFEDPESIIEEIANGARSIGAREEDRFLCIESRREAIERAFEHASPGDTVLLAGKGHEKCMIYGDQRVPWDDVEEATLAVQRLGLNNMKQKREGPA